MKGTLITTK